MKRPKEKKEPEKTKKQEQDRPKGRSVRLSSQQSVPFTECYENGMFRLNENTWSFVCEIAETGYLSKTETEQQRKYQSYLDLLNGLPSNVHYQEFIYNLPVDTDQYLDAIAPEKEDYENEYERTFFNLQRKFIAGVGRETSRKKYLVAFSFKNTAGENPYNVLYDAMIRISDKFKEIGSDLRQLTVQEVFAELYHVYHPFDGTLPEYSPDLFRRGLSVRDLICPDAIEYKKTYIRLGENYCRIYSITSYGNEIVDSLIYDLLSQNAMIYLAKHLEHESKEEAIKTVKKQLEELESRRQKRMEENHRKGTNYISLEQQMAIEGCNDVLSKLYGSEEFFRMTVYVTVAAKSVEELEQLSSITKSRALASHCTLKAITLEQDKALDSLLPLGADYLKRHQFMLSSEIAVATPFSFESYFDQGGYFYGVNDRSGIPVILNRKLGKSSNGFVFGVTGAGKGVFVKNEIANVYYQPSSQNDDIIVIDPTGEYLPMVEAFHGECISLNASSDTRINPLNLSPEQIRLQGRQDAIVAQINFLVAFLAQIKDTEPLTASEKSVIDSVGAELYQKKQNPTLNDFYNELGKSTRPDAAQIQVWLERYVHGSISLFSGQSTVRENNRFTVYDLRDLVGDLKSVGMMAMLAHIQERVMVNNLAGKWTWIYVDEFHRFFDEARNPYSAETFARMFAEMRKFGGIVTGITQLPLPVIQSSAGATMLANASFVVSSELDTRNIDALSGLYNLNDEQKRLLAAPQIGQYILRSKGALVQIRLLIPGRKVEDKNVLYDLYNTDFKDKAIQGSGGTEE